MKILQLKKFPIFDVFLNDGWLEWSRYLFKKSKLIHLAGNKISNKQTLHELNKEIASHAESKK